MSIVTKSGDKGDTGRFGGARVAKDSPIICAIGSVDELNSAIGLLCARTDIPFDISSDLNAIQRTCFTIGSQLATPRHSTAQTLDYIPRVSDKDIGFLERKIKELEQQIMPKSKFILPGGSAASSMCFWIRSVARRAERDVLKSSRDEQSDERILRFLNRASDYFYVLARFINQSDGVCEEEWGKGAYGG